MGELQVVCFSYPIIFYILHTSSSLTEFRVPGGKLGLILTHQWLMDVTKTWNWLENGPEKRTEFPLASLAGMSLVAIFTLSSSMHSLYFTWLRGETTLGSWFKCAWYSHGWHKFPSWRERERDHILLGVYSYHLVGTWDVLIWMTMLLFLLFLTYSMWWTSARQSWWTPSLWLILFLANSSSQFASQMVHSEKHITLAMISLVIKLFCSSHQASWPCIDFARL